MAVASAIMTPIPDWDSTPPDSPASADPAEDLIDLESHSGSHSDAAESPSPRASGLGIFQLPSQKGTAILGAIASSGIGNWNPSRALHLLGQNGPGDVNDRMDLDDNLAGLDLGSGDIPMTDAPLPTPPEVHDGPQPPKDPVGKQDSPAVPTPQPTSPIPDPEDDGQGKKDSPVGATPPPTNPVPTPAAPTPAVTSIETRPADVSDTNRIFHVVFHRESKDDFRVALNDGQTERWMTADQIVEVGDGHLLKPYLNRSSEKFTPSRRVEHDTISDAAAVEPVSQSMTDWPVCVQAKKLKMVTWKTVQ